MWMKRLGGASLVALCSFASIGAAGDEARLLDAVKTANRDAAKALLKRPGVANATEADGTHDRFLKLSSSRGEARFTSLGVDQCWPRFCGSKFSTTISSSG